ncbi:MAG: hypothetical protein JXR83_09670 [Deltaproteobacteria bacterium]|nr:hypothetical protein [Deltaproteobacteria bacterium]
MASALGRIGYEALVVSNPLDLPVRGVDADVVSVVAQNRYLDGLGSADLLRQLKIARSVSLPAVLICDRNLTEDERAPWIAEHDVRAFLHNSTSPDAVVQAVKMATRADTPADDGADNPFSPPPTLSEGADPFDLVVELNEVDSSDGEVDTDPHREVTKAAAIPMPPEALRPRDEARPPAAAVAMAEKTAVAAAEAEIAALTYLPPTIPRTRLEQADTVLTTVPGPQPDETAIDLNIMTLGLDVLDETIDESNPFKGRDAMSGGEVRLPPIAESKARDKPEPEHEKSQRPVRERSEAERRAKERSPKPEPVSEKAEVAMARGNETDLAKLKQLEDEVRELRKYKMLAERKIKKLEDDLRESRGPLPELAGGMFDNDESAPPSEGRFEQLPYPRLLGRLLQTRFTGAMSIRSGSLQRDIFFVEGKPVAYTSAERGDRLGRILVEQGRISEDQYLTAARRMVERGQKLTEALLELGFIDAERLVEEQRFLTRDQIVNGFGMTEGNFTLNTGAIAPAESPRFDFGPGEIYVAGYRQYAPEGEVKAFFENIRKLYLVGNDELTAYRPKLGLEAEDERLLRFLGQAYVVEEAVARAEITAERASRLLGALRGLGLVGAWNPGVAQFEERIRTTEQEHRAALLKLREEMQSREERLIDTFEKALARVESGAGVKLTGSSHFRSHQAVEEKTEPRIEREKVGLGAEEHGSPTASEPSKKPRDKDRAEAQVASAFDLSFVPPTELPKSTPVAGAAAAPREKIPLPAASSGPETPAAAKFRDGLNRAAQGQLDEAENALREAVRLDAQQPSYLAALARVLLSNPKYDRVGTLPVVRSLLERAQTLAPNDDEIRALLARVSSEQAQLDK